MNLAVSFGLMMALLATPPTRENEKKRLGYFIGFCFTTGTVALRWGAPSTVEHTGISLGPLLEMSIAVDPSIIATALFSTVSGRSLWLWREIQKCNLCRC